MKKTIKDTTTTTITRQDAALALAIMLLVRDAAQRRSVGEIGMHAQRLAPWICRRTRPLIYGDCGPVSDGFELLATPEAPGDFFAWRSCEYSVLHAKPSKVKAIINSYCHDFEVGANEVIPWLEHVGPTLPDAAADKPGKRRGPKPATPADRHADSAIVKEWKAYCKKEADENDNRKPSRKAFAESKGITESQFKAIQDRVKARQKRQPYVGQQ
jgi:hypothetical protein